jgi:hypothetical protein
MYFVWTHSIIAGAVRISEFVTRSLAERVSMRLEKKGNQEFGRGDNDENL